MGEILTYAALLALASLLMLPVLLLRRRPSGHGGSTRRPTTPHPSPLECIAEVRQLAVPLVWSFTCSDPFSDPSSEEFWQRHSTVEPLAQSRRSSGIAKTHGL